MPALSPIGLNSRVTRAEQLLAEYVARDVVGAKTITNELKKADLKVPFEQMQCDFAGREPMVWVVPA